MSSKAITERQEDRPGPPGGWPGGEAAPSVLREDQPGLPRTLGMIGAALVIFGGMALGFNLLGRPVRVGTGWATLFLTAGIVGLLFHALFDRDVQFRRLYMAFGFATLLLGAILCLVPYPEKVGGRFMLGFPLLVLALMFILAFLRNETDPAIRTIAEWALAGAGTAMAVIGLFGGNLRGDFFLTYGVLLSLLGLVYVGGFIGARGVSDDRAYIAAGLLGVAGLLVVLAALIRSLFPTGAGSYFTNYGFLLLCVGLLYLLVAVGLCSDRPLVLITRRELASFFFSPLAYLSLLGFAIISWVPYIFFISQLVSSNPEEGVLEPIVQRYLIDWFPVILVTFLVPVITMRLLSEEQRTGTLEVLMTAPVEETSVVLGKFLAALLIFLVLWAPFGLYLLAIPLAGGKPFDYRPLLSFLIGVTVSGAGFVSMGLFFSSLTRNQVASGVLTFAGMLLLLLVFFGPRLVEATSFWAKVFPHLSYVRLWNNTAQGKLVPQDLLFFLSMTILFLFLTVKVLESRKWR
jgi:ABC-type transport system involved in multi-copper enzyme maturation permease subunit